MIIRNDNNIWMLKYEWFNCDSNLHMSGSDSYKMFYQGPFLLTWINFNNLSMDT